MLNNASRRAAGFKNGTGIRPADDFAELQHVHTIGLKALERFVNLPRGQRLGAPARLGKDVGSTRVPRVQFGVPPFCCGVRPTGFS
jgi:hypothetical protein